MRERREWLATTRATLPHLIGILGKLKPTFELPGVADIDAAFITTHDFWAVIWDVDGTLMSYHADDIASQFAPRVRRLFRDGPGRHAIISNCGEDRFRSLGSIFHEIPVLRGYTTPNGPVFRKMLGGTDSHTDDEVQEILRSGGRQMRKPSGALVRYAMRELEVDTPQHVAVVGDQYFTDIASANLAGTRSIKVPTFRRDTFPLQIRFTQRLEGLIFRLRYGRVSYVD